MELKEVKELYSKWANGEKIVKGVHKDIQEKVSLQRMLEDVKTYFLNIMLNLETYLLNEGYIDDVTNDAIADVFLEDEKIAIDKINKAIQDEDNETLYNIAFNVWFNVGVLDEAFHDIIMDVFNFCHELDELGIKVNVCPAHLFEQSACIYEQAPNLSNSLTFNIEDIKLNEDVKENVVVDFKIANYINMFTLLDSIIYYDTKESLHESKYNYIIANISNYTPPSGTSMWFNELVFRLINASILRGVVFVIPNLNDTYLYQIEDIEFFKMEVEILAKMIDKGYIDIEEPFDCNKMYFAKQENISLLGYFRNILKKTDNYKEFKKLNHNLKEFLDDHTLVKDVTIDGNRLIVECN